jgi:hypothetical protein
VRELVDRARVARVMTALASHADRETNVYFTGGVTAVLSGWRTSTIDIDLIAVPDSGAMMRALPSIKEQLSVNLELAAPSHFIPVPAGWEDRSPVIEKIGPVTFHHFDLCAQALAKLERRHDRDWRDVREMLSRGLIARERVLEYFLLIEPELYRFPAIDPPTFRKAVEEALFSPSHD